MVQVLSDLNLLIKRAYISSDGEWFMDGEFLDFSYVFSIYLVHPLHSMS